MDQAYVSAVAALAGAVVGGITSLGTTWLTISSQARAARLASERSKREELYGRFMDELARLYAFAINSEAADYSKAASAFALKGRIMLMSSAAVAESAGKALAYVVDLAMGPRLSAEEVRKMMDDASANVIDDFGQKARKELQELQVG
jgi:hypothetical protein